MGSILMAVGGLMALIGWIWLIVVAFKASGALWGIVNIFFQPITGLAYCITQKLGWQQFGIMVGGWVLCILGAAMSR